jgi:hypothetical protein
MFDTKIGAAVVALLGTLAIVPVAAQQQQPQPDGNATAGQTPSAAVPDETVARTGAALKRVANVKSVYAPKVQAAATPDERARLSNEELEAAKTAIGEQGLTVDQYNNVMQLAQADPALRERLIKIAKSGH